VQAWMVASEIAKARRLYGNIRHGCYRGAQAKFRAVSLFGLCAIVGVLPMGLMGAGSTAQGRFATVMFGGAVFSTIAALTSAACPHGADRSVRSVYCSRFILSGIAP
jgi:Cu/Ag efflux pump CusA